MYSLINLYKVNTPSKWCSIQHCRKFSQAPSRRQTAAKNNHQCGFYHSGWTVFVFDFHVNKSRSVVQCVLFNGWLHLLSLTSMSFIWRAVSQTSSCTSWALRSGGGGRPVLGGFQNPSGLVAVQAAGVLPKDNCRWIRQCSLIPSWSPVSRFSCQISALNKATAKCQGLWERLGGAFPAQPSDSSQGCRSN